MSNAETREDYHRGPREPRRTQSEIEFTIIRGLCAISLWLCGKFFPQSAIRIEDKDFWLVLTWSDAFGDHRVQSLVAECR